MTVNEVPFSRLIQRPAEVTADLHGWKVLRLRRRDDEDLVLMPAERAEGEFAMLKATSTMFLSLMRDDEGARKVLQVLPEAYPWVRFMPTDAVQEFAVEFMETARACADVGNLSRLEVVVAAWRHTAEIYADPELVEHFLAPKDGDYGPVPPPPDVEG